MDIQDDSRRETSAVALVQREDRAGTETEEERTAWA